MLSLIIRFAFILFLCASTFLAGAALAQTKIVVGLSTINSRVTPLWIAEEKGLFAKNGLEVLVVATRVSQPAIAALIAGELQLVFGGASSALGAFSGGAEPVLGWGGVGVGGGWWGGVGRRLVWLCVSLSLI